MANSGVAASTYGSNLKIPTITVNAKGLITGVSEQQIPIVDDLTTGGSTKLLSAEQGKVLNDQAFGIDQTWQDVTVSRSLGTTYTNTTPKPIQISILTKGSASSIDGLNIYVDDALVVSLANFTENTSSQTTCIVPAGSTYRASAPSAAALNVTMWTELR